MKYYFKNYFFFRVDNERKQYVREHIMEQDHRVYRLLLIAVMIIQAAMFGFSFMRSPSEWGLPINITYQILYGVLFIGSLACLLITEPLYKKKKTFPYYLVVSLTTFLVMLWGAGISLLDSNDHTNLLYFGVAVVAASIVITIEPWVNVLMVSVVSSLFISLFNCLDFVKPIAGAGFYIAVASIFVLSIFGASFNFVRRVDSTRLEHDITSLHTVISDNSFIDEVTKVYNRKYFSTKLNDKVKIGEEASIALMIDVDEFSRFNDEYGIVIGDKFLEEIGRILRSFMLDKEGYIVRFDGDAFLVYFPKEKISHVVMYAESIRNEIMRVAIDCPDGRKAKSSVSIGVSYANNEMSLIELVKGAKEAMHNAHDNKKSFSIFQEMNKKED